MQMRGGLRAAAEAGYGACHQSNRILGRCWAEPKGDCRENRLHLRHSQGKVLPAPYQLATENARGYAGPG
jgi:hypothetical protein